MEVSARLKGARLSAQKARLVADQIRGKGVEEALQLLKEEQKGFHVIFLDLYMPKMNGIEVLENLKSHKLAQDATVIVWSSIEDERMKWAAFGLDAMLFVEKATALEGIEKILKDIDVLIDLPEEPSLATQLKAARG